MKLLETLPIVFVGLAALAVLALDDVPAYESVAKPEARPVVLPVKAVPPAESLLPSEKLVAEDTLKFPREAPKAKASSAPKKAPPPASPPKRDLAVNQGPVPQRIEVEQRRLDPDKRLQQAVMRAITRQPNLSGQIAVEARDSVVRLSGWTLTPGQSLRAEKAAARVEGVRHVLNEIRPRMGVITS